MDRFPLSRLAAVVTAVAWVTACSPTPPAAVGATPRALAGFYDPARDLGPLFPAVQLSEIFEDSKTFVDARPRVAPGDLAKQYLDARAGAGLTLRRFVDENFEIPRPVGRDFQTDTTETMEQHIQTLWPVLTRPADRVDERSSLIPLPNAYVVPGGRFREVYYWDSYFTMLGLTES